MKKANQDTSPQGRITSAPAQDTSLPTTWMKVDEAAEYLGLSRHYLNRLRGNGNGIGPRYFQRRPGGRVAYRMSDLNAWMETGANDNTAQAECSGAVR